MTRISTKKITTMLLASAISTGLYADDKLEVKFTDVGNDRCVLVKAPEGQMVYDTGGSEYAGCLQAAKDLFDPEAPVDLLVLSNSDETSMTNAMKFMDEFKTTRILRNGREQDSETWRKLNDVLLNNPEIEDVSLQDAPIASGYSYDIGRAKATYIAGWTDLKTLTADEHQAGTADNITVRLDYLGVSLLLAGDTAGRLEDDPAEACKASEAWMVANQLALLDVEILLAPGHGSNTANSGCFIEATSPHYVIFSAGHGDQLPSAAATERYLAAGVKSHNILRTDRGDDEGELEWSGLSLENCFDEIGDDGLTLLISEEGGLSLTYDLTGGC